MRVARVPLGEREALLDDLQAMVAEALPILNEKRDV